METERVSENEKAGQGRSRLPWVIIILIIVLVSGFGYWWIFKKGRVSTDNAYVMADIAQVSSRIPGNIQKIHVSNDKWVNKGDILIELDPEDYDISVKEAQASLKFIESQIEMAELTIKITEEVTNAQFLSAKAGLEAAKHKQEQIKKRLDELNQKKRALSADWKEAKREAKRIIQLYRKGAASEQRKDTVLTALKKAEASLNAIDAQIESVRSALKASEQEVLMARSKLIQAEADKLKVSLEEHRLMGLRAKREQALSKLRMAELKRSYCTIRAPISGYIAQCRIQVGERVMPGQPLLAIVPLQEIYIEANFKETQLEHVRVGQPAIIKADIYPDYVFHGHVAGIRAGTGAVFSLLPPENATGNWVKVVQRVPVKIFLDEPPPEEYPLRVGLSLNVTIDVSSKRSHTTRR